MPQPIMRSERLHPEVRALLEVMDAQGAPPLETLDPVTARAGRLEPMKVLGGQPDILGRVEDLSLPGPGGNVPHTRLRIRAERHSACSDLLPRRRFRIRKPGYTRRGVPSHCQRIRGRSHLGRLPASAGT